jgi:hypothetical protein
MPSNSSVKSISSKVMSSVCWPVCFVAAATISREASIETRSAARVQNGSALRDLPKKGNIQRAHVNRDGVLAEFGRVAVIVARG